jgi:hypothetical protein
MGGMAWMVRTPHPLMKDKGVPVRKAHMRLALWALLRWLGYAALVVGIAAIGIDLYTWQGKGDLDFTSGLDWWSTLHESSLRQVSRFVRGISEAAWDGAIERMLRWPAFATMGGFGVVAAVLGRRRYHV